ncbi:MAG: hypothetical protein FWD57_10155 [Polyangiaceae bacterium]|nr:hypothetical protein [Polyangiaceae bacterium]
MAGLDGSGGSEMQSYGDALLLQSRSDGAVDVVLNVGGGSEQVAVACGDGEVFGHC